MDLDDLPDSIEQSPCLSYGRSPTRRKNCEKWDRSNYMSFMTINHNIQEEFVGVASEVITNAKDFLAKIEKCFTKHDKVETSTILQSLIFMKYNGKGNVREYVMEMPHLASKLKPLKFELSDDMYVHLVLILSCTI